MRGYKLMISWNIAGTYETAEGEYSGIVHSTREECRAELIRAKKDLDPEYALTIEEV